MASAADATTTPELKRTPLHALNLELGGRMVPFAGYDMPVQFPAGVLKEHLHTRDAAGLFDVSHMGQIALRPKSGNLRDAALALESLVPVDIAGLGEGRQRYGFFTNESGGILDDLMIASRGDHLMLIVNAACKDADEAHLRKHLSASCDITVLDRALIALQGPGAAAAVAILAPPCASMRFMDVASLTVVGAEYIVSRSGYTGEDGYEISIPRDHAEHAVRALLAIDGIAPIGLGARDSLRLEAGLCLHGADITEATTPVEAALEWAIQPVRRTGGERAGGFPGADVILDQLSNGASRRRVGLKAEGRQPVRGGAALYASPDGGDVIGSVTSGGFGPTLNAPAAMGYVPTALAQPGATVVADVRGKRVGMTVTKLPFVPARFHRG
ncbi:MAG: glycine cleavage system aminomethyltransferase GcvT [Hyphomicrobiaceae bacterium]|nr:glycine cleavage system aminomethyltransferase GcvT [Hyphomicrobiaceae bacterium]